MVEEGVEHEELGLRGSDFNIFNEERDGCVADNMKVLPYLLIPTQLWPGDWEK